MSVCLSPIEDWCPRCTPPNMSTLTQNKNGNKELVNSQHGCAGEMLPQDPSIDFELKIF